MKTNALKLLIAICMMAFTSCSKDDASTPSPLTMKANVSSMLTADEILDVVINPEDFVAEVDNPYFPLTPGDTYYYVNTSKEGNETETAYIEFTVTHDTKVILGVTTTVVHDIETDEDGNVLEDTYDWYAQDTAGNVWYFGEFTTAYEDGVASTEGSWEAGVDGAKPGIIMWATPRNYTGEPYYQEYYPGEAEDQAVVLPSKRTVKVPYGMFHKVLGTEEFTALEPDVHERKYYVAGIGMVLAEAVKGTNEREELVAITHE